MVAAPRRAVDADNSTALMTAFSKHRIENARLDFEELRNLWRAIEPDLADESSSLDSSDQCIQLRGLCLGNLWMKTESDVYVLQPAEHS
jgi:hypothetical protein